MCSEVLFQDHDVLMLYDASLDGIEDPGNDANEYLRMGDLRPSSWFEYFSNVQPRDPSRGIPPLTAEPVQQRDRPPKS